MKAARWAGSEVSYAKVREDPAWQCHEIDSSHDVMIEHPDEVARILLDLA